MKKTFVILTIVLAMLAAPVFAEVTASGDVEFDFAYNGDAYSEETANDVDVTIGGTVGEYTSISAVLSADNDDDADDSVISLDEMTLTQDITGALGMDAAFGLSMTMGVASFEPMEYQAVAGYGDLEYDDDDTDAYTYNLIADNSVMTKASIALDALTIDVAVYEPGMEVFSDAMQYGVNAYGTFGMVDASVSYLVITEDVSILGVNGASVVMEGLTVGAGMSMLMNDGDNFAKYGVSTAYTMDALTAGFAFTTKTDDSDLEFMDQSAIALNVNYMLNDAATAFAAMAMNTLSSDVDMEDKLVYEVGASYALDGVTYYAGYTDGSDYNAVDGEFEDGNVFFKVVAEF